MIQIEVWDVIGLVGLVLLLVGLAAAYWPLALIFAGAVMVGGYAYRECATHAAQEPVPRGDPSTDDE